MDVAISRGHLDMVKFLHENRTEGCSSNALRRATDNVCVDVVKWLIENKPDQYTNDTLNSAAQSGNFELVMALSDFAKGRHEPTTEMLLCALRGKQFEVFEWLIREYIDIMPDLDSWVRNQLVGTNMRVGPYAREIGQRILAERDSMLN